MLCSYAVNFFACKLSLNKTIFRSLITKKGILERKGSIVTVKNTDSLYLVKEGEIQPKIIDHLLIFKVNINNIQSNIHFE